VIAIGRRLSGASLAAVAAALVSAAALTGLYGRTPAVRFEMDRDQRLALSGFYPSERDHELTFAWTRGSAEIRVPGLDRSGPWSCTVSVRGWRPPGILLPALRFSIDGVESQAWQVQAAVEDVAVEIPPRPGARGLVLGLVVSNTFRPGPTDPRDLGIAIDRIECKPASRRLVFPPASAVIQSAAGAAMLAGAFGLAGLPALAAAGFAGAVGLVQAWPLTAGIAPYYPEAVPVVPLALALSLVMGLVLALLRVARGFPASAPWRIAVAVSVLAAYLKLLILLHPSMPTMDALFQAHRLEWVLDGRFYFTSLTPSGYEFPYGISLYLAAAPFAGFMPDYVALLRMVVIAADAAAGLLFYAMVMRAWNSPPAALVALLLFHHTPIAQAVIGTANLTNAFGESVAVATIAALVLLPLAAPRWLWLLLPAALASVAFVAHFSTLVVLATTMGLIGLAWWWFGEPQIRRLGALVLAGLVLAVVFSFAAFYGHFRDTYHTQVQRLTGEVGAATAADLRATPSNAASSMPQKDAKTHASASQRVETMMRRTRNAFGGLFACLALAGVVRLAREKRRDRLTLTVWAWLVTLGVFSALAVLTPLEMRYHLSVAPALAALAAAAAAAWMHRRVLRVVACAWIALLIVDGMRGWYGWLF
jgi:hypothetical protein